MVVFGLVGKETCESMLTEVLEGSSALGDEIFKPIHDAGTVRHRAPAGTAASVKIDQDFRPPSSSPYVFTVALFRSSPPRQTLQRGLPASGGAVAAAQSPHLRATAPRAGRPDGIHLAPVRCTGIGTAWG